MVLFIDEAKVLFDSLFSRMFTSRAACQRLAHIKYLFRIPAFGSLDCKASECNVANFFLYTFCIQKCLTAHNQDCASPTLLATYCLTIQLGVMHST